MRLIKEGFDLASTEMKVKKRKGKVVDGGGRVVPATGRKDRHSKVHTARGPRDRRLRLSPTTAIQFYDVQDRLGFDRPSKAIDWLINEAKTAIDALEKQQSIMFHSPSIPNHGGFSLSQRGMTMREKQEHFNDDSLVSGFSCFGNEAALESYLDQDLSSLNSQNVSCSALNSTTQILETNWEMARLQKMVTWIYGKENPDIIRGGGEAEHSFGNSLAVHAAAQPIPGYINLFTQREPLQSSVINYSVMNNDFAGFNFSNELSKITHSVYNDETG